MIGEKLILVAAAIGAAEFCPDPLVLCDAYTTPDPWSVQSNMIPCIEGCIDVFLDECSAWVDGDVADCIECCLRGGVMPYIPKDQRIMADPTVYSLSLDTSGKLNFAITKLCEEYRQSKGDSYCTWNTIIGALECAKLEYARRVVAPYEDRKCDENGDVYAAKDTIQ